MKNYYKISFEIKDKKTAIILDTIKVKKYLPKEITKTIAYYHYLVIVKKNYKDTAFIDNFKFEKINNKTLFAVKETAENIYNFFYNIFYNIKSDYNAFMLFYPYWFDDNGKKLNVFARVKKSWQMIYYK